MATKARKNHGHQATSASKENGTTRRRRSNGDVARWVSVLLLVATVLSFVILVAALPSRSGAASDTPEATAGFLIPAALYLIALLGLRAREQRLTALIVVTLVVAEVGAGLDSIFPGVGWRLLVVPLGVAFLVWAAWIASPRGVDIKGRWWAVFGALLFSDSVLIYAVGAY